MEKQRVDYVIRSVASEDESFLWEMLYYAAHMDEDSEASVQSAMRDPALAKYVTRWGCEGDMGFIAVAPELNRPIGAAWVRLLTGPNKVSSMIDDTVPELAIAVLPEYVGKGVGSQLLRQLLDVAQATYPAIVLSVRATNPAKLLYERLGFVVVEEIINRVGGKSLVMKIDCS